MHKIENPNEMGKFLETHNCNIEPEKKNETLNRPIMSYEIEFVIRKLPTNKSPLPEGFIINLCQMYKEEVIPITQKLFQKIDQEAFLPD